MNGRPLEEKGRLIQDVVYVPVSLASDSMNERIYWDEKENILSLATSGGLVTVNTEDSMRYMLGKESTASEYQLLYEDGDKVFVAMDFVEKFSHLPVWLAISGCVWGQTKSMITCWSCQVGRKL